MKVNFTIYKRGKDFRYRGRLIVSCDKLVSLIVRNRDKNCVTCIFIGKYPVDSVRRIEELQCGHLFSRSLKSLRFDLRNCNAQCQFCNQEHERDRSVYNNWFIKKYGQEEFDKLLLESNKIRKWQVYELEELKEELRKELKKYETI